MDLSTFNASIAEEKKAKVKIRQAYLREKLKCLQLRLNLETSNETENLLVLFPEEIWHMICPHQTNSRVLMSLTQANSFFQSIVKLSPALYLFPQILPLLSCYLSNKNLLDCRLVCQSWSWAFESFLEQGLVDQLTDCSTTDIVDALSGAQNLNRVLADRLRFISQELIVPGLNVEKIANSFLGKSVTFRFKWDYLTLRNETLLYLMGNTLDIAGKYIQTLTFNCEYISHSAVDLFMLCQQVLETCPSLKYLEIFASNCSEVTHLSESLREIGIQPGFANHSGLKALSFHSSSSRTNSLQDALVEKFGPQLEYLRAPGWNNDLHKLTKLTNLTALDVRKMKSEVAFQWLSQLEAPKLRSLKIKIDSSNASLQKLFLIINNFKELRRLELKLHKSFCGWSDEEISSLPVESVTRACELHLLKISYSLTKSDACPCLNFLFCFSYTRELTFSYTTFNSKRSFKTRNLSDVRLEQNSDTVQLSRIIQNLNNSKCIYASNVWQLVPNLNKLRIIENKKTLFEFFRSCYDFEKLEYETQFKRHFEGVSPLVKEAAQEMGTDLRKSNNSLAKRPRRIRRAARIPWEKVLPQVLLQIGWSPPSISACRLVSTVWLEATDAFLDTTWSPKRIHKISLPTTKSVIQATFPTRQWKLGWTIEINITCASNVRDNVESLVTQVDKQSIRHVVVKSEEDVPLYPADLYMICIRFLGFCPNLKSLKVKTLGVYNGFSAKEDTELLAFDDLMDMKALYPPPRNTSLESISFHGPLKFSYFGFIQQLLIDVYGNRLKILRVDMTQENYRPYQPTLPQLTKLEIVPKNSTKSLLNIPTMAPNLRSLSIQLRGKYHNLRTVLILAGRLYLLTYMELQFTEKFFKQNVNWDVTQVEPCTFVQGVKTLKIVVNNPARLSFDFLIHFPFAKTLEIAIGSEEPKCLTSRSGEDEDADCSKEEEDTEEENDHAVAIMMDTCGYNESESDTSSYTISDHSSEEWSDEEDISDLENGVIRDVEVGDIRVLPNKEFSDFEYEETSDSENEEISSIRNGSVSAVDYITDEKEAKNSENNSSQNEQGDNGTETLIVESCIDVAQYLESDVYQSNIWDILKRLERITVYNKESSTAMGTVYTKERYIQLKRLN